MNINQIIDYECGTLSDEETLKMFADGIKSGMVWQLQGHYGRTAASLMKEGYISTSGEILKGLDSDY